MSRATLGLEWRDSTLTAVELKTPRQGQQRVRSCSETFGPDRPVTPERIRALLASQGISGGAARLAVSGRSVSIKPLRLPPLSEGEQLSILRQEGDRLFLLPAGARCYGLLGTDGSDQRWTVAASASEIETLLQALESAGVFVDGVTAAAALYPRALELLGLSADRAARIRTVMRAAGRSTERVEYKGGRVVGLTVSDSPDDAEQWPGGDDCVVLLDRDATLVGALAGALRGEHAPDLLPPAVRGRRQQAARRLTRTLVACVATLSVLFGWLVVREGVARRTHLEEAMARVRAAVEPVVAMQQELGGIAQRLGAYHAVLEQRVDHLRLLHDLSVALPETAWLVSLENRVGDRVTLSGYARSATEVLRAITNVPGLGDVRFERPTSNIRLGDEQLESFTIAAGYPNAPR